MNRARLTLILLFLLFLLPVMLAIAMRSVWWRHHPSATTNHGTLLSPPLSLYSLAGTEQTGQHWTAATLAGRWTLLGVSGHAGVIFCEPWIDLLRRVRLAQGRLSAMVGIVILLPQTKMESPACQVPADAADLHIVTLDLGEEALNRTFPAVPAIYLADPEGNIILRYATSPDAADLGRDLTRLLTWSRRE